MSLRRKSSDELQGCSRANTELLLTDKVTLINLITGTYNTTFGAGYAKVDQVTPVVGLRVQFGGHWALTLDF